MQCGSKERGGHEQSSRAGEAAGVEEVGRQARGWSHSSSHSLFVTGGGRQGQLPPPDRNTHTPTCVEIIQKSVNAQKKKKDKNPLMEQLLQTRHPSLNNRGSDRPQNEKNKKTERYDEKKQRGERIAILPLDMYCTPLKTI